jgi:hypothetical protein
MQVFYLGKLFENKGVPVNFNSLKIPNPQFGSHSQIKQLELLVEDGIVE